jgi:tRNA (guanine37-N1)-methyltransferase
MTPQPLFDTLRKLKEEDVHIIFTTPVAKPFNQNDAKRLAKKEHVAFVSGRYEGIDERVIETFADEVFSIGDYILTGGELPSLVMADAISRNVEGVLGNQVSLDEESFEGFLLEAPAFAKPPKYESIEVPTEYTRGNHGKINALKLSLSECKTKYFRPNELLKHKIRKNYEK